MAWNTVQREGHLQKRFSNLTMVGMAFAILKYVTHCNFQHDQSISMLIFPAPGFLWLVHLVLLCRLADLSRLCMGLFSVSFVPSA